MRPGIASERGFPYPYRAALALCSDLDLTPDRLAYEATARYLNTERDGPMGRGLGLEVGNTLYFDMPPDQFAYWNTDDAGRDFLRGLIRSGHIDCFHSFGDLATTRAHAGRSLDELERHNCRIEVWIDHATAPTNFGADIMRGEGDLPGAPAYHADLTCGFGVRYVWRGRVTSVVGQDVPRRLTGITTSRHPFGSLRTLAKEWAKGALARRGNAKYAMHAPNDLTRPVVLRDGRAAVEFLRANPYWAAVDEGETADGLADVLNERFLRTLTEREGACILYTHLGKTSSRDVPLGPATCRALSLLADAFHAGRLLVTTTRRLLGQRSAWRDLRFATTAGADGRTRIEVDWSGPSSDLEGLTFYVPDPERTEIVVAGLPAAGVQRNPPDHRGLPSVSLPWHRLVYPE
jgi:hypothetical protein